MSKVKLRTNNEKAYKKVKEVIDNTVIIQRQLELEYGIWNFVVFGPKDKNNTVIREGYAKHTHVKESSLYLATVGINGISIDGSKKTGIPIEEFTNGDIPEELHGLEILNIEPFRPLTVTLNKKGPALNKTVNMVRKEYEEKNIAIIQSPDEAFWAISILKYLDETDEYFPDLFIDAIKKGNLPVNGNFIDFNFH